MRLEDLVYELTGQRKYTVWNYNVFLPEKSLARYVYEKEHNVKVDVDHKIRFSDGNPLNFDIDNLILVDKNDFKRAHRLPRAFEEQTQGRKVPDYVRRFIETLVSWGYTSDEIRKEVPHWKRYKNDRAEERAKYDEIDWLRFI